MFWIDGAVRTSVRAGFATDTKHVVPDQHGTLVILLLQSLYRASLNAVGIFTSPANQGISG
jgi:hypothetical protein